MCCCALVLLACRTTHTAEDAVDTKWVMQQWVARGCSAAQAAPPVPASTPSTPPSSFPSSPASQTAHSAAGQGPAAIVAQTVATASSAPKKAGGFGGASGPTLKKASRKKT